MARHANCPGEDCPRCEREADSRQGDRDIDGSMADREADRYERWMDSQWQ